MNRRFFTALLMGVAAYAVLPMPGLSKPLNQRIDATRAKVDKKKRVEGVLTTTISRYNNRINGLQGNIRGLQDRQRKIQGTLDQKRAELLDARDKLEKARDRLVALRSEVNKGQKVLAKRLVALYKASEPDALSVVLQADGFADLLDRADFIDRVSNQDHRVITTVRRLKTRAAGQEKQLNGLENKIQSAATVILGRRNELASSKNRLVRSRVAIEDVRSGRKATLSKVRGSRHKAEEDLRALNREQARVQGMLQRSAGGGGPIKKGSGKFIWPVNGPITSPFCERRAWEACHPGIDVGVPGGTPIHAADSGRVAIASPTGGYGNYTCVNHSSSLSTCYAHQSAFKVSVGQNVTQGQVIGLVGCTGLCFGEHLHFEVRINGSVVNPMNYL